MHHGGYTHEPLHQQAEWPEKLMTSSGQPEVWYEICEIVDSAIAFFSQIHGLLKGRQVGILFLRAPGELRGPLPPRAKHRRRCPTLGHVEAKSLHLLTFASSGHFTPVCRYSDALTLAGVCPAPTLALSLCEWLNSCLASTQNRMPLKCGI